MTGTLPWCARPARMRGMTLLEIMVVVVIIAVIVSIAVINIGDNSARALDQEGQRLRTLIRLAADDAVLQGREIGLTVTEHDYQFLVYDDQSRTWNSLQNDSIFRPRKLPGGVTMELFLDDQLLVLPEPSDDSDSGLDENGEEIEAQKPPQILLLSSGEMTPFELVLEIETSDHQVVLRGSPNGRLEESGERL